MKCCRYAQFSAASGQLDDAMAERQAYPSLPQSSFPNAPPASGFGFSGGPPPPRQQAASSYGGRVSALPAGGGGGGGGSGGASQGTRSVPLEQVPAFAVCGMHCRRCCPWMVGARLALLIQLCAWYTACTLVIILSRKRSRVTCFYARCARLCSAAKFRHGRAFTATALIVLCYAPSTQHSMALDILLRVV